MHGSPYGGGHSPVVTTPEQLQRYLVGVPDCVQLISQLGTVLIGTVLRMLHASQACHVTCLSKNGHVENGSRQDFESL